MKPASPIPKAVQGALATWLRHHDERATGLIEGLYLVGSAALGNWQPSSDIDIVAFTTASPTEQDIGTMRSAHIATMAELGDVGIDGPRLLWSDVAGPPEPLRRPWTLDGEFHHDDGCFEINPVTWYTLATYGLAIRGPEPAALTIDVDVEDRLDFVRDNTATYWRSVGETVAEALADPARETFGSEMTSWIVLGAARMLYTARTGDVASKSAAGEWLINERPAHRSLIEHALAIRHGETTGPDNRATAEATAVYLDEMVGIVAATAG